MLKYHGLHAALRHFSLRSFNHSVISSVDKQ